MRKTLAILLSVVTLSFGAPIVGIAQAPTSILRGQIVDAGGRGATGMRVEVVKEGFVVATAMTTTDGHFSVAGLPTGNYVVRTMVNGQPSGVRISVEPGQSANALVVLPSVATAAPSAILINVVTSGLVSAITAAATVVVAEATVTANEDADLDLLRRQVHLANQLIDDYNAAIAEGSGVAPLPIFTFIPTAPVQNGSGS